MDEFDHFVKGRLGIKYYGRYVDDFIMVDRDKEYLKAIVPAIKDYLKKRLFLQVHPDKIYLQHFSKGVKFLGVVVKPYRMYVGNRAKGNFYRKIRYWNNFMKAKRRLSKEDFKRFLSSMNSYLGHVKNYQTNKLRKKMLGRNLSVYFWNYVCVSGGYRKMVPKRRKAKFLD